MEQEARYHAGDIMRIGMNPDPAENIKKRTIVIEFLDDYQASLCDFLPWIIQHGGTNYIRAMGNVKSPYIWHITTTTPKKAEEIMENPPLMINGRDVLVYHLLDNMYTAQLHWIPYWLQTCNIRNAVRAYVRDFHLRRLRQTENGFHYVFNTRFCIFSPVDLNMLPNFLKIESGDSTVYARVVAPARLRTNEPIFPKLPCTFGENDDEVWHSNLEDPLEMGVNEHFV